MPQESNDNREIVMDRRKIAFLRESITELCLCQRTLTSLDNHGIFTVENLLNCCPRRDYESCMNDGCERLHLLSISNFGEKTLEEVLRALAKAGFGVTE